MPSLKPLRTTSTDTRVASDTTVMTQRPWQVIVWDDPVTPMKVVVVIFKKVFGYSDNKATELMLQVHHQGRSIVWSGEQARAERYCVQLTTAGLAATIHQDS